MSNPKEQLFYPLLDQFDKDFFALFKKATKEHYSFIGDTEDRVFFIKSLLCFQMIKDYRAPLKAVQELLSKETDLKAINNLIKQQNFNIDYSWAVWTRDENIGEMADKFYNSTPEINGDENDFNEFVLRYLVSIWLTDWEGPLYAVLKTIEETDNKKINLKELNKLLSLWDFTNIFS